MSEFDGYEYIVGIGSATTREFTDEELEEIERQPKNPIGFGLPEEDSDA